MARSATRSPDKKAPPLVVTTLGVWPNSLCQWPIGALVEAVAAGTVSSTGARFRSTPERRSCRPHVRADDVRVVADHVPMVRAVGIREKPLPWSTWT